MTVQEQTFVQPVASNIPVPTTITNVIATLNGSVSPNRTYVILAHIDDRVTDVLNFTSDSPGADADASGVAVVIELARVMANLQPNATIVFSLVAGEEQGLYGSSFEAKQLNAAGVDVEGMLNVDTVGSSTAQDGTKDAHEIRLFTEGVPTAATPAQIVLTQLMGNENDSSSRELGRFASRPCVRCYNVRIMCGRYRRTTQEEEFARLYHIPIPKQTDLPVSYNIAPSQKVLTIRFNPETRARPLDALQWGLIPYWAEDSKIAYRTINARAESVDKAPPPSARLLQNDAA
jgi:hypothetical protein